MFKAVISVMHKGGTTSKEIECDAAQLDLLLSVYYVLDDVYTVIDQIKILDSFHIEDKLIEQTLRSLLTIGLIYDVRTSMIRA